jgi:predicted HicB family RNase H-like nuclease
VDTDTDTDNAPRGATRKFNFAGPARLYTEARVEAAYAGVSLTTFCTRALRAYVETCRVKREKNEPAAK